MKDVSRLIGGFSVADLFPSFKVLQYLTGIRYKAEKMHKEIDRILEKILRYHQLDTSLETKTINEKEGEDFVDVLLRLQKQNNLEHPLSDRIIKANMLVSIFSILKKLIGKGKKFIIYHFTTFVSKFKF
jgi:hypothetical protein